MKSRRSAITGRLVALTTAVLLMTLVSCTPTTPGGSRSLLVFAAASLTDAFDDVADAFEDANPATSVDLNLAGSSSLREQILAGAPADVFASANMSNMDRIVEAGAATDPQRFATNTLEVAVPDGNPAGIRGLADLARADLLIGLCAEPVPCGALARLALERTGVTPSVDTYEPDVRALLTKIEAGELDGGIVYASDVVSAGGRVEGLPISEALDVTAAYQIARIIHPDGDLDGGGGGDRNGDVGQGGVAQAFVEFVLGGEGQAILREHGFGSP